MADRQAVVITAGLLRRAFVHCTLDVFDPETLTITSELDQRPVWIYTPGTWREAWTENADGWPETGFVSALADRSIRRNQS